MGQNRPRRNMRDLELFKDSDPPQNTSDPDKPLSAKQKLYVDLITNRGVSKRAAARLAGFGESSQNGGSHIRELESSANVQAALAKSRSQNEAAVLMTKKKVMEGFLESIEMAKSKGDPFVMIAGWREVAKMCGYYEPIKHKLEIDAKGQIIVQRLQTLTDAQLVQLAQGESSDIIEGEIINEQTSTSTGTSETGTSETEPDLLRKPDVS